MMIGNGDNDLGAQHDKERILAAQTIRNRGEEQPSSQVESPLMATMVAATASSLPKISLTMFARRDRNTRPAIELPKNMA